jgi:nitrate reductase / nitrite oxidoreductase, beta subunit
MKVRAQIAMVLNLDKCIGCHTCSITCKNVWTSREGMEYAWFNNVESKPGIGYPKQWENQDIWNGGWKLKGDGKLEPRQGSRLKILANIFGNPNLPEIDDYYEPFTYDYQHLQKAPLSRRRPPRARSRPSPARRWTRSTGAPTGKTTSAANSPRAVATRTSTTCRRKCTRPSRTPS